MISSPTRKQRGIWTPSILESGDLPTLAHIWQQLCDLYANKINSILLIWLARIYSYYHFLLVNIANKMSRRCKILLFSTQSPTSTLTIYTRIPQYSIYSIFPLIFYMLIWTLSLFFTHLILKIITAFNITSQTYTVFPFPIWGWSEKFMA